MVCRFVGANLSSELMMDIVNSTLQKKISELLIEIPSFSFKKRHLKVSYLFYTNWSPTIGGVRPVCPLGKQAHAGPWLVPIWFQIFLKIGGEILNAVVFDSSEAFKYL